MPDRYIRRIIMLIFLASGTAKLLALDFEIAAFERWGYPYWFMYLTGVLEVIGGMGMLIPTLGGITALALAGLMVGAVGTHLINAEWPMAAVAIGILGLCGYAAWRQTGPRWFGALASLLRPTNICQ